MAVSFLVLEILIRSEYKNYEVCLDYRLLSVSYPALGSLPRPHTRSLAWSYKFI
jgi:hypothetical protein